MRSRYAIASVVLSLSLSLESAYSFTPIRLLVQPSTTSTSSSSSTSSSLHLNLYQSNDNDNNDDDNDNHNDDFHSRKMCLSKAKSKAKPVAVAILTVLSLSSLIKVKASYAASAPVTPIRQFKPQDQKKIALQKMNDERNKAQMKDQMAHQLKCEEIESTQGKNARKVYEEQYERNIILQAEARVGQRKELLYTLVSQGICPFMDLEGERQVYQFDHGIDLATVPTTAQQKEFMNLRRNPKLKDKRAKERFIIKCIVDDLIAKGEDPLTYLENNKDKTREIFALNDKKLDAIATRYKTIIEQQGTLSGQQNAQQLPFDIAAAMTPATTLNHKNANANTAAAAAAVDAVKEAKAVAKREAQKLKVQKKAEAKAAKAVAKAEAAKLKAEAKAANEAAKAAAKEAAKIVAAEADDGVVTEGDNIATLSDSMDESSGVVVDGSGSNDEIVNEVVTESVSELSTTTKKTSPSVPMVPIIGVVGVAGAGVAFKVVNAQNAAAEEERQKQFRLIMGLDSDDNDDDVDDGTDDDDDDSIIDNYSSISTSASKKVVEPTNPTPTPVVEVPKKRRGLASVASVFSKKSNNRETDLNKLFASDAPAPEFSLLLAKLLSFGAPGRFPLVTSLTSGMPMEDFNLEDAKKLLIESRSSSTPSSSSLTNEVSAEAFACVVNCMIIDIIDLASSSLGGGGEEKKKNKMTVDALNVVLDFMDHAASLFDAVADDDDKGVVITPVTYGGSLSKSKLEKMFTIYASSMMTSLDGSVTQDRVDTLQQVFNINDKRAEGIVQKGMMKNLMNMMKDPEAMEGMMGGMEGMEGMEGLSEMMAAMSGDGAAAGAAGMPGFDPNGEISPEELKQSVTMMKQLVDSGSVSKDELDLVRNQFKEIYGSDINDLIKAADEEGTDDSGGDGKELLDLFKTILKED